MDEYKIDDHKLIYHPERITEFKKNGDCFPIYVEFGLTDACNHKCIFCALDYLNSNGNFIDKEIVLKNLKDMADNGLKSLMFAGEGEPLLHKDIGLFVKKAKEFGIDVSITTNGTLFDSKKREECLPNLKWIRFSIDSGSAENYSKIHGTFKEDFEILMKNIEESVKFKTKNNLNVTIGTQFLLINENIQELPKLAEKLKKIGVDNLQVKPYSHHPKSFNNYSITSSEFKKAKKGLMKMNSDKFKIIFRKSTKKRIDEGINYPECYGLSFFTLIDAKGNVIPCNLFYNDPEFTYGNLYKNIFSDIWKSNERKKVIKKIVERGVKGCRIGCRLDSINRYLHRLKNPGFHDNFI
ncbi:MAG: radical SAM protein [Candidatus Pacearchaeota archaeon]